MAKKRTHYQLAKSIRKDWNGIKPFTRVQRDRTKYTRKVKHPSRYC